MSSYFILLAWLIVSLVLAPLVGAWLGWASRHYPEPSEPED